jgi:hypothetical protein
VRAGLRATRWPSASSSSPTLPPIGLVASEALSADDARGGAEVRRLLGDGVALALERVGDDGGFGEMARVLGRVVEMTTGGATA